MSSTKPDLSQYNKIKEYKCKKYSGVKVGHGHKWQYEAGEWKETKTAPDKWKFTYKVGKKRARTRTRRLRCTRRNRVPLVHHRRPGRQEAGR